MERRFKLGSGIVNAQQKPTLKFSEDGKHMILTFPIISDDSSLFANEKKEDKNPQRHTHRDIFELNSGDAFGSQLAASLVSVGSQETILSLSMRVNSKVPGTGAAFAALSANGNGHEA